MDSPNAGRTPTWPQLVMALAITGEVPGPGRDEYVWLVWMWHLQRCEKLSDHLSRELDLLPVPVRALREDTWVRRYLECAARDFTGKPLSGGTRTAWLTRQRRRRESGALPRGQVLLLSTLNGFSWTPDADQWESMFDRVRRYVATHGRVPSRADDADLAGWLATQRFSMRQGRLSARRAEVLEALPGFAASMSCERADSVWDGRLAELRQFVSSNGRYPRAGAAGAERRLYDWIGAQRDHFRRADLGAHRIEALEAQPGWRWSAHEADFDDRTARLDRDPDVQHIAPDHSLYRWIIAARRRHRDGRLSPDQAAALDSMNLLDERLQHVS